MVVAFLLPEEIPRQSKRLVRALGGEALECLGQFGHRDVWAHQHVDVVRHNDKGVQYISTENGGVVVDRLHDYVGYDGLPQISWPAPRCI